MEAVPQRAEAGTVREEDEASEHATAAAARAATAAARTGGVLEEVLPRTGLVFSERGSLSEVLCKPKILPLKSATLLRMEQLERKARELAAEQQGHSG
jgi:hypothetical protein